MFREHPPGFPGAPSRPAPGAAAPASGATAPDGAARPAGEQALRTLTALVLAALVLVAAAATVAWAAERQPGGRPAASAGASSTPTSVTPTTVTRSSAAPLPAAAPVPASPAPGQAGAGALAFLSVPLGRDGLAARLTFGGVVLEPRAVGLTVAYPSVSVTTDGHGTALAHVQLETFNCLTDTPPPDPAAAGCVRSVPEYADLPSPALTVTGDDDGLRLSGRFPTYTRPNGTPPLYTGRVYELEITLRLGRASSPGRPAASGELVLGEERAASG
jgi:hypothetical protein